MYDWTRTYLLCVPEASVYSSVFDQQQRDLGNHTQEWSAREQRFDFIHPLGHRTRSLKAWKKKFTFISVACAVTYSRSACKTYLVKRHYAFFVILCDTQTDIQNQKLFYSIEGVQAFLLGAHLIYILYGYEYPVWCSYLKLF